MVVVAYPRLFNCRRPFASSLTFFIRPNPNGHSVFAVPDSLFTFPHHDYFQNEREQSQTRALQWLATEQGRLMSRLA